MNYVYACTRRRLTLKSRITVVILMGNCTGDEQVVLPFAALLSRAQEILTPAWMALVQ